MSIMSRRNSESKTRGTLDTCLSVRNKGEEKEGEHLQE